MADCTVVYGDLLDQPVDAIVNPWNSNVIPWWLLLPQGVSGAIRKRAGAEAFHSLTTAGFLKPGTAVFAPAGKLAFKGIIHVAALTPFWATSETILKTCVKNAIQMALSKGFTSLAFPLLGSGVGGQNPDAVAQLIRETAAESDSPIAIHIVIHQR
jgi:O-acetyl-ADP-ribose deacetylase (regulator of RNase III)